MKLGEGIEQFVGDLDTIRRELAQGWRESGPAFPPVENAPNKVESQAAKIERLSAVVSDEGQRAFLHRLCEPSVGFGAFLVELNLHFKIVTPDIGGLDSIEALSNGVTHPRGESFARVMWIAARLYTEVQEREAADTKDSDRPGKSLDEAIRQDSYITYRMIKDLKDDTAMFHFAEIVRLRLTGRRFKPGKSYAE
jgi:hypothetical protein